MDQQERQDLYRSTKELDEDIDLLSWWVEDEEDETLKDLVTTLAVASDAVLRHLKGE